MCGHLNIKWVSYTAWKVRCGNSTCRAQFAFGETFYLLPGGGRLQGPLDKIVPDYAAMPEPDFLSLFHGELAQERFRSGGNVNRLVVPEEEDGEGAPRNPNLPV